MNRKPPPSPVPKELTILGTRMGKEKKREKKFSFHLGAVLTKRFQVRGDFSYHVHNKVK